VIEFIRDAWSRDWKQERADWNYPIHLGVTEAGEGEDGTHQIRPSALWLAAVRRLGRHIRVSLTEDSPREIEVLS